ncbi:MAG: hypothetical protein ACI9DF_004543 [Verrucomicrobiales bacterium]|jgi:hypothetical protein
MKPGARTNKDEAIFAEYLVAARLKLGRTRVQQAMFLDLAYGTLALWEQGKRTPIKLTKEGLELEFTRLSPITRQKPIRAIRLSSTRQDRLPPADE